MPFPETPAALHLKVDDVDQSLDRALKAGASSIQAPADQDYGEQSGSMQDPFGNQWYLSKTPPGSNFGAGLRTLTPSLHPGGAAKFIEFVQKALGAEVTARYDSPEGKVLHARLRIGDSIWKWVMRTGHTSQCHLLFIFISVIYIKYINEHLKPMASRCYLPPTSLTETAWLLYVTRLGTRGILPRISVRGLSPSHQWRHVAIP
jgi:uncharacterized glyoxalase superfamily protein PhnB